MKVRRLDDNGESRFGRGSASFLVDGDAVAQNVYMSLKLTLGEWFLDTTRGVAWMRQPAGKPAVLDQLYDEAFLTAELKRVILQEDGVAALNAFALDLNRSTRKATASARVSTIYGTVQTIVARYG